MDLIAAAVTLTLSIGLGLGACRIALGTIFLAMARAPIAQNREVPFATSTPPRSSRPWLDQSDLADPVRPRRVRS